MVSFPNRSCVHWLFRTVPPSQPQRTSEADLSIKPALTPDEWAGRAIQSGRGRARIADGGALEAEGELDASRRHALAALALHGQPFGFTWKDVDLIRSTVLADDFHSPDDWFVLQRLADRIAALLPPREPRDANGAGSDPGIG